MTGNEAAKAVAELCKRKRHAPDPVNRNEAGICQHCWEIMEHLRSLHRDSGPTLSTTTVHMLFGPDGGLYATSFVEESAHIIARERRGVVVSWPVSGDYRKRLGSRDIEPSLGARVQDARGVVWTRYEDGWGNGQPGSDPKSWAKVVGDYGPVTVVASGGGVDG